MTAKIRSLNITCNSQSLAIKPDFDQLGNTTKAQEYKNYLDLKLEMKINENLTQQVKRNTINNNNNNGYF